MNRPEEPLSPAELEELNELVGALREGTITDQQTARLDQMVAENPAAMATFCEMIQMIAELHSRLGGRGNLTEKKVALLPLRGSRRTRVLALAASLALLVTASAALWVGVKSSEAARLKHLETAALFFNQHSSALLHVKFEHQRPSDNLLTNLAATAPTNERVKIAGCGWSKGHWPGKGAVDFKKTSDGLTVSLPGRYESLTFLAWVRIDHLPAKKQQGILMTKSQERGSLQWYIQSDGSLGLGLQLASPGAPQTWRCLHSPPVIPRDSLGKWMFVACVIDGAEGAVTHYYNGRPMGMSLGESPVALRLDTLGIGNWPVDPADQDWTNWRAHGGGSHSINLSGGMDEVAIFSSALRAEEIRKIYDATRGKASGWK